MPEARTPTSSTRWSGSRRARALDAIRAPAAGGARSRAGELSRAVRAGDPGGDHAQERFAVGRLRHRPAWRGGDRGVLRRGPRRQRGIGGVARRGRRGDRGGQGARPLRQLSRRPAEPRGHRRAESIASRREHPPACWVRASPRRSSTCTCSSSTRATPTPAALQALLDAGWSTTDIVTLSQIAAFLSFQIRVVAGLRALAGRRLTREVPT